MGTLAKIVDAGGLASQVILWAGVSFFVVGGAIRLLGAMLNLWNAWRTRPR